MGQPRGSNALRAIDALAALTSRFDFHVDSEDFILYETALAIEEERASLDDPGFQALIDAGIREHAASNLAVRAEMAGLYRAAKPPLAADVRDMAGRVIGALENLDTDLCDVGVVVRSYAAYLFRRLAEPAESPNGNTAENAETLDDLARGQIASWREGALLTEQLVDGLAALGRAGAPAAADLLFDAPDDAGSASAAVRVLGRIGSPIAARALAHAISEPMLDEAAEQLAIETLRRLWPLPKHYMLLILQRHEQEDLPVRWFQLLAESQAAETVEYTLEEVVRHAGNPAFQEDLSTILDFLATAGDPETASKIMERLNDPDTPAAAVAMLEGILKTWSEPAPGSVWLRRAHLDAIHSRYRAAAQLLDEGKPAEATAVLNEIHEREPGYPFAIMLRALSTLPHAGGVPGQ